jgi:hypothetical protein
MIDIHNIHYTNKHITIYKAEAQIWTREQGEKQTKEDDIPVRPDFFTEVQNHQPRDPDVSVEEAWVSYKANSKSGVLISQKFSLGF